MGRDEHRSNKNSRFAQTPKQQLKPSVEFNDVEFSGEISADEDDMKAQRRSRVSSQQSKKK